MTRPGPCGNGAQRGGQQERGEKEMYREQQWWEDREPQEHKRKKNPASSGGWLHSLPWGSMNYRFPPNNFVWVLMPHRVIKSPYPRQWLLCHLALCSVFSHRVLTEAHQNRCHYLPFPERNLKFMRLDDVPKVTQLLSDFCSEFSYR